MADLPLDDWAAGKATPPERLGIVIDAEGIGHELGWFEPVQMYSRRWDVHTPIPVYSHPSAADPGDEQIAVMYRRSRVLPLGTTWEEAMADTERLAAVTQVTPPQWVVTTAVAAVP